MDESQEKLPALEEIEISDPAVSDKNTIQAVLSAKVSEQALKSFSEAEISDAIKNKKEVFKKQLNVENFAQSAEAHIAEKAIESKLTEAGGAKAVIGTKTKAEKELAYFDRHKDTLAHYKVNGPCSEVKMFILVFTENFATLIAFPLLFIFRFATLIVTTFGGLAESVQKLIKAAFVLIIIGTGIAVLINYGIIKVGS